MKSTRSKAKMQQAFVRRAGAVALCAGLGMAMTSGAARGAQVTASWLNPASGSWTDAAMWSTAPSFPNNGSPAGTTYHAVIDAAGAAYTVTLGADVSIDRLTMDAVSATLRHNSGIATLAEGSVIMAGRYRLDGGVLTGDGDLEIRDRMLWEQGSVKGSGTLRIAQGGELKLQTSAEKVLRRAMVNEGVVNWSFGLIALEGASVTNTGEFIADAAAASTTLQMRGRAPGVATFVNTGEFRKVGAGALKTDRDTGLGLSFRNDGVVRVEAGSMTINDEVGAEHTGAFIVDLGATLRFDWIAKFAASSHISGAGLLVLGGQVEHGGVIDMDGTLKALGSSLEAPRYTGPVSVGRLEVAAANGPVYFDGSLHVETEMKVDYGWAHLSGPVTFGEGASLSVGSGSMGTALYYEQTDAALEVAHLTLRSEIRGAGDVAVTQSLWWQGTGIVGGGRLDLAQGAVTDVLLTSYTDRSVVNDGLLRIGGTLLGAGLINGGTMVLDGTSTSVRYAMGAGLELQNTGELVKIGMGNGRITGDGVAVNAGALRVEEGTLTVESILESTGSIEIASGARLQMTKESTIGGAVSGGGLLEVISGPHEFTADMSGLGELRLTQGSIAGAGALSVGGTLRLSGGSSAFAAPVGASTLVVSGGTHTFHDALQTGSASLTGGALSINGPMSASDFVWSGGTISGAGSIHLLSGGASTISGNGSKIVRVDLLNEGDIAWITGTLQLTSGAEFHNAGDLVVNSNGALVMSGASGNGSVVNSGAISKFGAGTLSIRSELGQLQNLGLINALGGTIELLGGVQQMGAITIGAGGTLRIGGNSQYATGSTIGGAGDLHISGGAHDLGIGLVQNTGALRISGGDVTLREAPAAELQLLGGSVNFEYLVDLGTSFSTAAALHFNAGYSIASGADLTISGGGSVDFGPSSLVFSTGDINGGLSGAGDLTFTDGLIWRGGALNGPGAVRADGGPLTLTGATKTLVTRLESLGDSIWSGGAITLNGGRLVNEGLFTTTAATSMNGAGAFENNGSVVGQGAGAMSFGSSGGTVFENNGSVVIEQGQMSFLGSLVNSGAIEVWNGATLRLGGVVSHEGAGSITGAGAVEFVGGTQQVDQGWLQSSGELRVTGGVVNIGPMPSESRWQISGGVANFVVDQAIGSLTISGGAVGGEGALTVGAMEWLSGSLLAGGGVEVEESGALTFGTGTSTRTLSRTFTSHGSADLAAGTLTINDGVFENAGTMVMNGGASIMAAGAGGVLVNSGLLTTTGAGVATLGGPGLTFENSGVVDVASGTTLRLLNAAVAPGALGQMQGAGGVDFAGGVVSVEAGELQSIGGITVSGGNVRFREGLSPSVWTFSGGSAAFEQEFIGGSLLRTTGTALRFEGGLTLDSGATMAISGLGSVELIGSNVTIARLQLQGGGLLGQEDLTLTEQLSWTGGTMSGAGRTIVESGTTASIGFFAPITLSRELVVRGDSAWGSAILRMDGGMLRNEGQFVANAAPGNAASMTGLAGGGVFLNEGSFVVQGGGQTRLFRGGGDMALVNTGVVEVREGRLRLLGADATSNGGLYDIRHSAMVEVEGAFENEGGAALAFEVGGMKERGLSGLMTITGEASLAGTLVVSTPEPFSAAWGDRWTIMTYGSLVGDFDSFELPTEGFAARGDAYGASDLRWYAEAGANEYVVGVSHIADIDHDGLIGFSDLNVIVSNFNTLGGWALGDVDGDGFVGFADLNLVASLFNVAAPRSVPAPGGVVVLGLAAAAGLRRRREGNRS